MSSVERVPTQVKWGKETLDVEMVVAEGVSGYKKKLEGKTNVPVDRMKLMPKSKGLWKGVLRDDFDLSSLDLASALKKSDPVRIMMMGSAAALAVPAAKTVFLEDMAPEEVAKALSEPVGLVNMGNTCYLNSVTQCLKAVPVLRNVLERRTDNLTSNRSTNPAHGRLLDSLRNTYRAMESSGSAVPPVQFVAATKTVFPQFAQTDAQGRPMQQDAEEFLSGLLAAAANETAGPEALEKGFGRTVPKEDLDGADNCVDAVFGLKMEETLTCDEFATGESVATKDDDADDDDDDMTDAAAVTEPPVVNHDLHRKLVCNIQGGPDASANVNVNHVAEGISLSLNGKIEKRSEVLGRDAVWTARRRVARLPPVLVVQFGRFYWKATPNSADRAGVKCKVMKPVSFNDTLDVYEFCNERVQRILKVHRDAHVKAEEERLAAKEGGGADGDAEMENVDGEEKGAEDDDELKAALAMSMEPEETERAGPGLPDRFRGIYELFAVVTHKGRNADGGHYMGWVKADVDEEEAKKKEKEAEDGPKSEKKGEGDDLSKDRWFVFDDDEVSPCTGEEVMKLKGGGDYHMSYLNFYRAMK